MAAVQCSASAMICNIDETVHPKGEKTRSTKKAGKDAKRHGKYGEKTFKKVGGHAPFFKFLGGNGKNVCAGCRKTAQCPNAPIFGNSADLK